MFNKSNEFKSPSYNNDNNDSFKQTTTILIQNLDTSSSEETIEMIWNHLVLTKYRKILKRTLKHWQPDNLLFQYHESAIISFITYTYSKKKKLTK